MSHPAQPSTFRLPAGARVFRWAFAAWTGAVLLFLYLPILVLVAFSFNASRLNVMWQGFTWRWHVEVWSHAPLVEAAKNSLIVATITTLVSVVLGTGGAWLLHRYRFRGRGWVQMLVGVPIVMPEVVMGVSLLVMFTSLLLPLGFVTVIIAHITFSFPFVLLAVQARLAGLDPALEEAALDLGARPLAAFWWVIVPSLRPAIVAGALMAFTLSMDEVIVTYFTTGPGAVTLPLRIFGMAKVGLSPMLNAISAVFVVATVAIVLFSEHLKKLRT